jgi:hypothetical protein
VSQIRAPGGASNFVAVRDTRRGDGLSEGLLVRVKLMPRVVGVVAVV